eukprot:TRINITY_DN13569_c0_g1_i1.p1 TRINITY_DN13569_c0_g1~~TRINITY_DN13569_c0_g1_i1.p1  ORF type:complete len:299 (+),score=41.86 TRINITY_DN13569_c0_g1_i1:43-939(+)
MTSRGPRFVCPLGREDWPRYRGISAGRRRRRHAPAALTLDVDIDGHADVDAGISIPGTCRNAPFATTPVTYAHNASAPPARNIRGFRETQRRCTDDSATSLFADSATAGSFSPTSSEATSSPTLAMLSSSSLATPREVTAKGLELAFTGSWSCAPFANTPRDDSEEWGRDGEEMMSAHSDRRRKRRSLVTSPRKRSSLYSVQGTAITAVSSMGDCAEFGSPRSDGLCCSASDIDLNAYVAFDKESRRISLVDVLGTFGALSVMDSASERDSDCDDEYERRASLAGDGMRSECIHSFYV